jgi:probable HAF family extracellular repeat protein
MKFKTLPLMTAMMVLSVLVVPSSLGAQVRPSHPAQTHYRILSLGTLGGSASQATAINDFGLIAGESNLMGDVDAHAVLWLYGYSLNLGTLGGPNSAVLWPGLNDLDQTVGISDTAMSDPLGESWSCGAFLPASHAGHTCVGFLWQIGAGMTALPTLGGNNGFATSINNRGQAVGWAENTVHDPTCNNAPPVNQYLQFEAVIWGPRPGQIQQLPPFSGDPDGAATGINDHGQVVGISGICQNAVGNQSATHALLWQNGTPTNLGSLGGTAWNTPMAINSRGDIVGFSDLTGDDNGANPNFHAFLWIQPGPMQDLKTLAGDAISEALGINNQRQVVGTSIDGDGNEHAFIWQNGQLTNLNSLIHGVSPLYLQAAQDINDSGVIVGLGCVPGDCLPTSLSIAFVAIPTYDGNEDLAPAESAAVANHSPKTVLSDTVRQRLLQRGALGRIGPTVAH